MKTVVLSYGEGISLHLAGGMDGPDDALIQLALAVAAGLGAWEPETITIEEPWQPAAVMVSAE